jgi:hypothetical protein
MPVSSRRRRPRHPSRRLRPTTTARLPTSFPTTQRCRKTTSHRKTTRNSQTTMSLRTTRLRRTRMPQRTKLLRTTRPILCHRPVRRRCRQARSRRRRTNRGPRLRADVPLRSLCPVPGTRPSRRSAKIAQAQVGGQPYCATCREPSPRQSFLRRGATVRGRRQGASRATARGTRPASAVLTGRGWLRAVRRGRARRAP